MIELDASADFRGPDRVFRIFDERLFIQQRKDLLRTGNGVLKRGELLRELLNGLEERLDILHKDEQRAQGNGAAQNSGRTADNDDEQGENGEEIDEGPEGGVDHHFPPARTVQAFIVLTEFLKLALFLSEELNDAHTGKMF